MFGLQREIMRDTHNPRPWRIAEAAVVTYCQCIFLAFAVFCLLGLLGA